MAELKCIVVTPERTVLEESARFIAMPLYDGEIGIAPGHSPIIGRLGCGEMRLVSGDRVDRYYVEGGFVEVLAGVVSVLTSRALPAGELDELSAREDLQAALARPAHAPELMAARDRSVAQARARLRMSRNISP